MQRDPAEEEDGQDEVGEEGGEVNHLESHQRLFSSICYCSWSQIAAVLTDVSKQRYPTDIISRIIFHGYDINLSRGGDAFAKDCIDDQPRDDQADEVPVLDPNKILCKRWIMNDN